MQTRKCPKCSAKMEEGFLADFTSANVIPSIWVGGAPEPSFWAGPSGAKLRGKTKRRLQTYRCVGCGYLESFATAEWPDK